MQSKLNSIKLLVSDCDGVLTNGLYYYGLKNIVVKNFHTQDGLGINMFQNFGYIFAIITGKNSLSLKQRCEDLGIKYLYQGIKNKLEILENLRIDLKLSWENIAYIGDDLNDLQCLEKSAFSACPADANKTILDKVDFICTRNGGYGCVREVIDFTLKGKNELEDAQNKFIKSLL